MDPFLYLLVNFHLHSNPPNQFLHRGTTVTAPEKEHLYGATTTSLVLCMLDKKLTYLG